MSANLRQTLGWQLDLYLCMVLVLLATALMWWGGPPLVRVPIGLIAGLFLPGYALAASIFPLDGDLDGIERLALAFGLSLAILIVLVLPLSLTPWGINASSMPFAIAACTIVLAVVAWLRRIRVEEPSRFRVMTGADLAWTTVAPGTKRALLAAAAMVVLAATGLLVTVLREPPRYTEFYVLGPEGLAQGYPRAARVGQTLRLTLGIKNAEGVTTRYDVAVSGDGERLASAGPFFLNGGATQEVPIAFHLSQPGPSQDVDITLSKNGEDATYRYLRLWIDVSAE